MSLNQQLAFDYAELHSPKIQREKITQDLKFHLLEIYATVSLLGPITSDKKAAALGTVVDLDTRLKAFLDSIFGKVD